MPDPFVERSKVYEPGTKYHRSRLVNRNGQVQTQADYTGTVEVRVFDLNSDDADTAVYSNTAVTIASVITNTLQSWDADAVGWNFEHGVTSNNLVWEGGHTFRVEYVFKHTSEGNHTALFEDLVEPSIGS